MLVKESVGDGDERRRGCVGSRSAGAQARRGREAGGVGAERARRGRGAGEEELCVCGGAGAERVEQRRRMGAWRRSEGTGGGSRGRREVR